MKFLEQVQADLKQAVLEHQRDLLLQVLQRRSGELTLGDLRKLLASPLGRGLDEVRVAALFVAKAETPDKIVQKARQRARGASSKATITRKAKSQETPREKLIEAVFAALQSAKGPLSSTEIAAKVKTDRRTVRVVLQQLSDAKRVVISGSRQFTRYASPETGSGTPRRRKTAMTAKARRAAAHPAVLTQDDYDAAVLANLRALGSMSSSQLQASVGGTLHAVRAALQRLITSQQVSQVGQHKNTRYVPGPAKPPDV